MFDLQGHRGARGLWPENTLGGFARTLALGVRGVELDCAVTRDGVVVVTHDPELNPDCTRDARGRFLGASGPAIRELTYAQLQAYDVGRLRPGSDYAARFPQQQPLDGERIPRLADVLSLIGNRGNGEVRVAIEVKTFPQQPHLTPAPEAFVQAISLDVERTGSAALVEILAFDWRVLRAARQRLPGTAMTALTEQQGSDDTVRLGAPQPSPWLGGLDPQDFGRSVPRLVQATGADTWGPDHLDLDAAQVAEAHVLGLRVVPWTVNDPQDLERLVAIKVDGMVSDRPDLMRALLKRKGMTVPPQYPGPG